MEDGSPLLGLVICQSLYLLFLLGPTPGVISRETVLTQLHRVVVRVGPE